MSPTSDVPSARPGLRGDGAITALSRLESLSGPVRRAIAVGRAEGWRSLAIKGAAATCYSRLTLLERSLEVPLPALDCELELELRPLIASDAEAAAELVPGESTTMFRERLRAGGLGFAALYRGRLIGVSWAATGRVQVPYLRAALALFPDEALEYGTFVAPDMRAKHVASQGGIYRLRWLRDAGYRHAITAVLPENEAGFGPPTRLGYRRVGTAYGVGIGAFRRVIVRRRPAEPAAALQR